MDRNHQQRSGRILRLNDKTVTLMCGQQQRRGAYGLLHRIVDGSAASGELPHTMPTITAVAVISVAPKARAAYTLLMANIQVTSFPFDAIFDRFVA